MSDLLLLLLRIGFLVMLWFFVFAVVYSLRADLFGVRVRKMPAAEAPVPAAPVHQAPRPSAPAAKAATRLIITSGPKEGLEVPLGNADSMSIGRSSESGLVIRDDYTSSHHARLLLRGDTWAIQDLDSTNGTFLAGNRITGGPSPINIGDTVKVGATTFELRA